MSKLNSYKVKKTKKEIIEPEEIFLDSQLRSDAEKDFLQGQKIETPVAKRAILFFSLLVFSGFAFVWSRAFQLQIWQGEKYSQMAEDNQIYIVPVPSPRGLIYDKNNKILAQNVAAYDLIVNPALLKEDDSGRKKDLEALAEILKMPIEEIEERLSQQENEPRNQTFVLKADLSHQEMLALGGKADTLSGIFVEEASLRSYPFGAATAHLLGYLGNISEEEISNYQDYFLTEKVGKSGLEFYYEDVLRGLPGFKRYFFDASLEKEGLASQEKGTLGQALLLNIDVELQQKLYEALEKKVSDLKSANEETGGAAGIILDPRDGAVRALVSLPSFDNNEIVAGLNQEQFQNFFENPARPLFNRAIAGQYPSGSVIKPIMAVAGLEEEIITPNSRIDDMGGNLSIVNPYNQSVVYSFGDWKTHGVVNLYSAIAQSCNIYFYILGGGYQERLGLGIEKMVAYFKEFGLGQKTAIDLPGEKEGFLPTPDWKQTVKGESWYIGDTYHVAIGQGDFLATPLQLAAAFSIIANGGTFFQPQVVDKIVDSEENTINDISPKVVADNIFDAATLQEVRKGMRQAVLEGSASRLSLLPVSSAGKTGTAQTGETKNTHAWFVGFVPYENPELVIAVLVENGGEGHAAAVPVVLDVLDWYFSENTD